MIGNAGGLAVMWDDSLLELDGIATTDQEIYAIIKVRHKNDSWRFSYVYMLVRTGTNVKSCGKTLKISKITTQVSG